MNNIFLFTAPKTAGCTTICLNLALLDQLKNPENRIGLLQMTAFGDIHHHLGLEAHHNFSDLVAFHKAGEWTPETLSKIITTRGISIIQAPTLSQWRKIDITFFTDFITMISGSFDRLYIDFHGSTPDQFHTMLTEKADQSYLFASLDPCSLEATKNYLEAYPKSKSKTSLIFNQIPKKNTTATTRITDQLELKSLTPLPCDSTRVWHQIFEGLPVALQRGPLKKALVKLSEEILQTSSG
ncbi:MAG TPA: hypothetical protein VIT68_02910 [Candidatus Gracilibacteria bacterium]